MSRSNPSTLSRIFWAACGLALCVLAAPLRAQTLVTTTKFSLTYPAGWMNFPLGSDTSGAMVMNLANEAASYLIGAPHSGGAVTTDQLMAAMLAFGGADSLTKTAEGTKTLGGKAFSFLEFKQAVPEEGDENARFRVYFYTQGNFLFEAILGFDTVDSPTAVADIESALATLTLSPSAGIRRVTLLDRPGVKRSAHDVLGRALAPLPSVRVSVPAYSRH